MSKHTAAITKNNTGSYYALIIRHDRDGETSVIHGYAGRHFKTLKGAERSTAKYIAGME